MYGCGDDRCVPCYPTVSGCEYCGVDVTPFLNGTVSECWNCHELLDYSLDD